MATPPPSASILGFGRFGRALTSLFEDAGVRVAAHDPSADIPAGLAAGTLAELAGRSKVVVCAVPVPRLKEALKSLKPHLTKEHLVLDVASVKDGPAKDMKDILGNDIPWAATHPLFGPMSIARGERPLRVVVCPGPAEKRARELFEGIGCEVMLEDAAEHDRVMAETHALAFFVAKGMLEAGTVRDRPFSPPSFQAMAQTIDAVRSDAGHLFYPIARLNPFAAEAREKLLAALSRIHREIETAPGELSAQSAPLAIPVPAGPAPELRETRELIDELDGQLLGLLARRIQLAYHAARVKSGEGRPVRDPEREKKLLDDREARAEKLGLAGGRVREVFAAVLAFSRAEQERWLADRRRRG